MYPDDDLQLASTISETNTVLRHSVINEFMSELILTYRGTIYPWHCDHMGHMNVMWYTGKFDEASWQMLARFGLTRSYLREQNSLMAAVQQDTTYKRELRAGDVVTIRTGIIEVRQKVLRFLHEMRNDETGEIAAFTALTGVHMDMEMRRAHPFPTDFLDRVRQHVSDHGRVDPDNIHDTLPQGPYPTDPAISGAVC